MLKIEHSTMDEGGSCLVSQYQQIPNQEYHRDLRIELYKMAHRLICYYKNFNLVQDYSVRRLGNEYS